MVYLKKLSAKVQMGTTKESQWPRPERRMSGPEPEKSVLVPVAAVTNYHEVSGF